MRIKTGIGGGIGALCTVFAALFLTSCGALPDLSNSPPQISTTRRLFVNDQARNDSLVAALARTSSAGGGLLFVLQPGQTYHIRLATDSTRDQMSVYGYTNSGVLPLGTFVPDSPAVSGDTETFTLESNQSQATWFAGLLEASDGFKAGQRIRHVSLVSLNTAPPLDTFNVNLIMVGDLTNAGLPDSASKAAFASAFKAELGSIYAGSFNPVLNFNWTYSITSPKASPVTLNFGSTFVPLPGARAANAANLYLVDSISFVGGAAGEEILGFSPREVVDLSTDEDSRVILSARAAVTAGGGGGITNGIASLATTTAHELGHFFGLRHPTATTVDLQSDNDTTNKDDGFPSTPLCSELTKSQAGRPSAEHIVTGPHNRPYCLYVAEMDCPNDCDISNLMFAYSCGNTPQAARAQRDLTGEQQAFFRKNLALLQGK